MHRSTINQLILDAQTLLDQYQIKLPPFAHWTPDDWRGKGDEVAEIRDNALGWDITDFGSGDFARCGLVIFTVRNGNGQQPARYPKPYAEKILIVQEGQVTPMHFHWQKREDIINRGGGNLVLVLYKSTLAEGLSDEPFSVALDGVRRTCQPGERVVLTPGESICLEPTLYHEFYGEPGTGPVIVGEVSSVNDDVNDNRFLGQVGRFPQIEEDVAPIRLLCTEYPPAS